QPGYGAPPQPGYGAPQQQSGYPQAGVDPNLYNWFQAVDQDRSGRITATELQQALTNANWSHFNPETCRLMIGMFDRDFSGTIDFNEFCSLWNYIHQWKGIFDRFDGNRSGTIESQELQSAFSMMGFNVSPRFVQLIVWTYDTHGRRSLTLDKFIQSSVMLKSVTDTFKQKDTNLSGVINVGYEDFMYMAMSNKP
ncbi:unnamed protein product, partial [Owenia fusiformis]